MLGPAFFSWLLPLWPLLLWPGQVSPQAPIQATSVRVTDPPDCPEACACAPGGQANCSARELPAVPAGLNRQMRALLLDHNLLQLLLPGAFADADALVQLDLSGNRLGWVHARAFWGLSALQQLDLSINQLEALAPGTFAPLRALRTLSLAGNRLARLEPTALGTLPLLRVLSLQNNALSTLAPSLLAALPSLNALTLRGNPWTCDCALRPLCTWLRRHPRPASETEPLLCASPRRLTLSRLTALPDAAFRHCAQSLAARDLAVIYTLGPVSFLASLASCLALGCTLAACRARRRRRQAAARRRPRRPLDIDPGGPAPPENAGSPAGGAADL
ncbi:leucine-rich repeat-containing protein 26 [Ochotona curzoniae]|uniref:leucine-rich repeat-containing protein 26 n=1 Tax=Ochotona curzoniae TaxID=130825 RepID=UPI001B352B0D|nr:leucine-rich repeat-containing protein 26 [Ochotona curzoniae]